MRQSQNTKSFRFHRAFFHYVEYSGQMADPPPECVNDGIRNAYPSGVYMGYHPHYKTSIFSTITMKGDEIYGIWWDSVGRKWKLMIR